MAELKLSELRDIAKSLNIKGYESVTRHDLVVLISNKLGDDPSKRKSKNTYKRGAQLGESGKDGKVYAVTDKYGTEYAMKVFKKTKSSKRLLAEIELQRLCSDAGISPRIVDFDTEEKFIVMEKMDTRLYDILVEQKGVLTEKQQSQLVSLFKALDKVNVFHGDANILNYMYKRSKLYIVDFGYSKQITPELKQKLGTTTPNADLMLVGLIFKLKEMKCPPSSYSVLVSKMSPQKRVQYNL